MDRADGNEVSGPPPEALVERFQELSAGLEQIADPLARQRAEEMISVVLDLYGEGLRRIFDALERGGRGDCGAARRSSPTTASSPA